MKANDQYHQFLAEYLLRQGDNCLILSQRLSSWCGNGPTLEEDLALSNIALGWLGQARMWLQYAGSLPCVARSEDELAGLRDAHEFRNVLLVEQPNENFADIQTRLFLFTSWYGLLLDSLIHSHDERIAAIAAGSAKQIAFYLQHSRRWIVRLGDGTAFSRAKLERAFEACWDFLGELFLMDDLEKTMLRYGVGCNYAVLYPIWCRHIGEVAAQAKIQLPQCAMRMQNGKQGRHSEHLVPLLMEMQYLQRSFPGSLW
ncbi:1,2-phenylacetyl-CoA epoxidase subunit PaaC [Paraburkholderia bannensis]|uniref:1,2-phenylacetyl-CoA epoxidase subunit PaaC n=1 Tax=Paraburkholderia bannensis TaxID=765414 RepID=UPI0005A772F3|nr:1,2-phenylacetyl-CoA epoxidase subunit PaaC [Paraburkholderia bannensis]